MATMTIDLGRVVGPQGPQGPAVTIDSVPVNNSDHAVSSGGVYAALLLKQDTIEGGASSIVDQDLLPGFVLVSDSNGKVSQSLVNASSIEKLPILGTAITEELDEHIQAEAQHTDVIYIDIPATGVSHTLVLTGWLECTKKAIAGRYGAQIYASVNGDEPVLVQSQQNYYDDTIGNGNTIGWNLTYIASGVGILPVRYYLHFISPASPSSKIIVTRAVLKAVYVS